ncbi:MAG: putative rane protein [Ramlibacter sp.]|nr:putative rane protein [Ramlibacter sp.]
MNEIAIAPAQAVAPAPQPAPPPDLPLAGWVREGLRSGVFLPPRVAGRAPRPLQLLLLVLLTAVVEIGLGRLEVAGPASFNLRGYLASWWGVAASVLLVWSLLWGRRATGAEAPRPAGVASWFALWMVAALVPGLVSQVFGALQAHERLAAVFAESALLAWSIYFGLWAWTVAIAVRLGWHFGLDRRRLAALALGLCVIFGLSAWQLPDRPWEADAPLAEEAPRLVLSQESIEAQQAVWQQAVAGLAPQRPGVVDVYGLVFAPYGSEEVFLRESTLVADVLAQRFDAQGRVLQLVNNPATAATLPWATPLNLRRAVEALAQRMDKQEDVLVVYLTSHGASNFQLSAANPPLEVDTVSPGELRRALDEAGIRNRVIAISACFSGGWVGPLASDSSLVMTAADAEHTSYGCGSRSELTFFGRAMFDEQLRRTRSFEQAFAAAVPVIRQREVEARKPDGFSNPQISVGEKIRPVLQALEQRLDQASRP